MKHLLTRLWGRFDGATLAGTTFCDACGEVCTPTCRREAQLDRCRQGAYRDGLPRF
jgi:hypothetical protein